MISDRKSAINLKEITGVIKDGIDITERTLGEIEGELIKIDMSKINSDGWYVKIIETSRYEWMFMRFKKGDFFLPNGNLTNGILMVANEDKNVLVQEDENGAAWNIIDYNGTINTIPEPGEKIIENGTSRIRVKKDSIIIEGGEVFINGI